jgi:hypothetical protein
MELKKRVRKGRKRKEMKEKRKVENLE